MKVFLTGATGYIGSVVAEALQQAGHTVTGLARSEESARRLEGRGIGVVRGALTDGESIVAAARAADGVIHTASSMDADTPAHDRVAVDAILSAMEGSGKPFVYTSGIWVVGETGERIADESTPLNSTPLVAWRPAHEQLALAAIARGVRSIVIRPAMVYGRGGGIIAGLVQSARENGATRYVGTGENRWPLVHVEDLADLYVRALERAPAGTLLHAASGPSVRVREIAAAASRGAGAGGRTEAWPLEEARTRLGAYAEALALDQQFSNARARQLLGWEPHAPDVITELERGSYVR